MGKISPEHLDALCEIDNITLGAAATNLEKLTGLQVKMIKPRAKEFPWEDALSNIPIEDRVFLLMEFKGDYTGKFIFIFSRSDIMELVEALYKKEGKKTDQEILKSGLLEIGNKIGVSIVESLSMLVMKTGVSCNPLQVSESPEKVADDVVLIEMQFKLGNGKVDSKFWHIVPVELGNRLAADMLGEVDAQLKEFEKTAAQSSKEEAKQQHKTEQFYDVPDVTVELAVRLADKKMLFQELWELSPGSVIEFPQYVSQPVDIIMKGKVIAKAQVVTVGERFGVRVMEVNNYA